MSEHTDSDLLDWLENNMERYLVVPPITDQFNPSYNASDIWTLYDNGSAFVSSGQNLRECLVNFLNSPYVIESKLTVKYRVADCHECRGDYLALIRVKNEEIASFDPKIGDFLVAENGASYKIIAAEQKRERSIIAPFYYVSILLKDPVAHGSYVKLLKIV